VGLYLLAGIHADTPLTVIWASMFVTGVGIGPTMSGFTLIVQNAVSVLQLGVATSNLTFFRQIGGSVGLAVLGTVFGTSVRDNLPGQVRPVMESMLASAPAPVQAQLAGLLANLSPGSASLDLNEFTGVGQSFGSAVAGVAARAAEAQQAGAGAAVAQFLAPYVARLDQAFFEAFSLAMGQVFVVGVATTIGAAVLALAMRELPLRTAVGHSHADDKRPAEARPATALGRAPKAPRID
jgi:hypothetical protein